VCREEDWRHAALQSVVNGVACIREINRTKVTGILYSCGAATTTLEKVECYRRIAFGRNCLLYLRRAHPHRKSAPRQKTGGGRLRTRSTYARQH
jgi:hypothetical protein